MSNLNIFFPCYHKKRSSCTDMSSHSSSIIFQNIDAVGSDMYVSDDSAPSKSQQKPQTQQHPPPYQSDPDDDESTTLKYVVTLFGRTKAGRGVAIEIHGFKPSFLVDLTNTTRRREMERVAECLGCCRSRSRFGRDPADAGAYAPDLVSLKRQIRQRGNVCGLAFVRKRRLQGFDHFKWRPFVEYTFETNAARKKFIRVCYEQWVDGHPKKMYGAPTMSESDLDPLIAMFHQCNVESCNWMVAEQVRTGFRTIQKATENIHTYSISVQQLRVPSDTERSSLPVFAPVRTLFFDIECESSHGEFPLARKTCMRPAHSIVDLVSRLPVHDCDMNSARLRGIVRTCVQQRLRRAFDAHDEPGRLFTKRGSCLIPSDMSLDSFIQSSDVQRRVDRIVSMLLSSEHIATPASSATKHMPETRNSCSTLDFKKQLASMRQTLRTQTRKRESLRWSHHIKTWDRTTLAARIDTCIGELVSDGVQGDRIIQIGVIVTAMNTATPLHRIVFVLGGCDPIEHATIQAYNTESELLRAFAAFVRASDPDILSGYNIIPFDLPYIFDRALECDASTFRDVTDVGRIRRHIPFDQWIPWSPQSHLYQLEKMRIQRMSSAAAGSRTGRRWDMTGRVQLDPLAIIREQHKFDSYKLDAVASHFMYGRVQKVEVEGTRVRVRTNDVRGVAKGNYVHMSSVQGVVRDIVHFPRRAVPSTYRHIDTTVSESAYTTKLNVHMVSSCSDKDNQGYFEIDANSPVLAQLWAERIRTCDRWNQAKDDISPKDIFRLQKGTDADRAQIAKYCIKDVLLPVELMNKILAIENNVAYANLCGVPLSWITDRGVGAKLHAFMCCKCRTLNYALPRLYYEDPRKNKALSFVPDDDDIQSDTLQRQINDMYVKRHGELRCEVVEGAFVLKPEIGIYDADPIVVTDYTSLYPSAIISKNMSHETVVYQRRYQGLKGRQKLEEQGYLVYDVSYDARVYTDVDPDDDHFIKPRSVGRRTVRFACERDTNGRRKLGIVPLILNELLAIRKKTKREMKRAIKNGHSFLASVLNGRQQAEKIAANSLYGQMGSRVSKMRKKTLASATTAEGRHMLLSAQSFVERHYTRDTPLDFPDLRQRVVGAHVIYGDTDSIFIKFTIEHMDTRTPITGQHALVAAIRAGQHVESAAAKETWLSSPHVLEYEKTYFPYVLVRKKKYVGIKYTTSESKGQLHVMGLVLKRRDNPPILKRVYGAVIDGIMKGTTIRDIVTQLQQSVHALLLRDMRKPKRNELDELIITKQLRDGYKNPRQIAHKVLANRIAARDPGKAPKSSDRIPYIFIKNKTATLQGDRIETPDHIMQHLNTVRIDYEHYVQNVIMRPVSQILALRMEQLPKFDARAWTIRLGNIIGKRRHGAQTREETRRATLARRRLENDKQIKTLMKRNADEPTLSPDTDDVKRLRRNQRSRMLRREKEIKKLTTQQRTINEAIGSMDQAATQTVLSRGTSYRAQLSEDKYREFREKATQELVFISLINNTRYIIERSVIRRQFQ